MKKPLLILVSLLVPLLVLAQQVAPTSCKIRANTGISACPTTANTSTFDTTYTSGTEAVSGAMCCMFSSMNYIINWIFMILMVLSAIVVIWGAVTITTAGGAPEKVTSGRNLILYAVIGFAVALLSRGIPGIVKTLMGIA